MEDAVYIVEYSSISHGIGMLDRMLKRSSLFVLFAGPICIGKYLIALGGDVADAKEAQDAGESAEPGELLSSYLLTSAHPTILSYFRTNKRQAPPANEAIGIFETKNAASGFISLDAALKSGRVWLMRLWIGRYIGGKFCYVLGGTVSDVREAVKAARAAILPREFVGDEVIASPDKATLALFLDAGR